MTRTRVLALTACLVLSIPAGAQSDSVRAWGRRYTDWFFGDHLNDLYAHFAPSIHEQADSAKLVALRQRVADELGQRQYVVSETITAREPYTLYDQTVTVEKIAQAVIVRFGVDETGRIGAFVVLPSPTAEAPSAFLDYQTKTVLRLPFTGTWVVVWGGRTLAQNRYAAFPDRRFAYDFVVREAGSTHRGDGKRASDYYCYGRPVLAPGAGTIADLVDSVHDNAPGAGNDQQPLGNYVVIDHGNGEYSFLSHLERGSLAVTVGERVRPGMLIGHCGSSGDATEPHLHYNVQSTPSFMVGAGMPAQFQHYVADGKPVDRGEPTRGQSISP
jgi:murein DD-endopeptidase MepM/ murein hydrolase activator NlpD